MAPIYEYECDTCKMKIEVLHSMKKIFTNNKEHKATKCKGKFKKQISKLGGFILKGKGFFRNDYPKEDK